MIDLLMGTNERSIAPPKMPLTLAVNGAITDFYFDWFMAKHMPVGVSWIVTSKYRDPIKNKSVGGASNSSHVHNLGRDFVLMRDNKKLTKTETNKIFKEIIKPKWSGYALNEGDHIHVNISRLISRAAGILSMSVLGIIGVKFFSTIAKRKR